MFWSALIKKPKKVFQSIFLILFFLLFATLGYMTFFMNQFVLKAQMEEVDRSNLWLLGQAEEAARRLEGDVKRQVRYFLANGDSMQHLTNPQDDTFESNMAILRELKHFTDINTDVSEVWFYAQSSDMVLSSDGFLTTAEESTIGKVLADHYARPPARSAPDISQATITTGENLYIIIDFAPSRRLGSYIFQINIARLKAALSMRDGDMHILIADSQGSVFLTSEGVAKKGERNININEETHFYMSMDSARNTSQRYYRVDSNGLGWHFLMELTPQYSIQGNSNFWALTIPVVIFLLIAGSIGAYAVTKKIYSPINRLMTLVVEQSGQETFDCDREVDYLAEAYERTWRDNDKLRSRFSGLGSMLRIHLCRQALAGTLDDKTDTEKLLGLEPGGSFQVAMIRFGKSALALDGIVGRKLQLSAVEKRGERLEHCLCCFENGEFLIMVYYFSPPKGTAVPRKAALELEELAVNMGRETCCQVFLGSGACRDTLTELSESYHEALENLQYHIYLEAVAGDASTEEMPGELRLRRLVDWALIGKDDLNQHCYEILNTITEFSSNAAERESGYRLAENILMEKILTLDDSIEALPAGLSETGSVSESEFLSFCQAALERGRFNAGKKKHRYAEEGRRYIEENYMNANLSACDISSHIGISPPYFSSIFNEVIQSSVVTYLNEIRVKQAKNMLITTHIPVKEIGFRCGFNSASVFGRVFKRFTGCSPKQFRDQAAIGGGGGKA